MTMMSDPSEDLVEEILSKDPARSLKRLRSTCKQWNTLFNDHRFTKKHYDKAPKEFLVLMLKTYKVYLVSVKLSGIHNNIDPVMEVKGELGLLGYDNYTTFHCNGLLLCTTRAKPMEYGARLVVYNPCMGQTKWIELRTAYKASDKFALGYKKNCNSYKILRFSGSCHKPVFGEFEIYEFNSDSWRVLDDAIHDWHLAAQGRGVSYKGNTYWVASDTQDLVDDFLLEFDFTKERFRRLRLPFKDDCQYNTVVPSTVREEKLAVLFQSEYEEKTEIWLTSKIDENNDEVSWRKFFTVKCNYMFSFSMSFMVDEENKLAVCCDTYMGEDDK
ncbi:unnamed protein product [Arabidopsis lyrata]|uniref:F-box domain-containing protein n=1 Tax=Arabidopsis lyrata subsp. lyrata TaxID=81972 RepID=D7L6P4_ARALL|nr:putative F-box/kelch-repeat protein At1g62270 [Arabidopsis lyrata subsp. lyrata]EFH61449.1 hypothetical protein ARALYDRAFT_898048 [Arabidopsis lyrata subsp. lyrata]CAH8260801.1 unnamed protein product [Arabidopsis lyrata]|eukprot:XP_002885190.1 putative F-box/kelch-repeat protein At1g62270 [Arabidopsis lyrata subsp. lyrata]